MTEQKPAADRTSPPGSGRALSPVRIGSLQLRHRIVMGSMHLNLEQLDDGGAALAQFYRERADGGADLIVTGGAAVSRTGAGGPGYTLINEPGCAAALSRTVDAVHAAGGHLALQLFHAGRYAFEQTYGLRPVAPSAVYSGLSRCEPAALTAAQIEQTIADFAAGAGRARGLGFDAVEIMGSEGYLLNQFASPLTNLRRDEWGGDAVRRRRFPVAVLRAVRAAVGAGFPIIVRTSGTDLVDGSSTDAELDALAVEFACGGADALNIGIGWHESTVPTVQSLVPHGHWLPMARRIKRALLAAGLATPVIGSNRLNSLPQAEAALAAGDLDLVSMARPFLADPAIIATSRAGRLPLVNTCIGCNEACLDRALGTEPVSCLVNPRAGHELEFPTAPAAGRAPAGPAVAVAGAGPAGMQAAATLAAAGLAVDLYEAAGGIGGQFRLAGRVPGKEDFLETIRYFEHRLVDLGVRVLTDHPADAAGLAGYAHVVVGTGVLPRRVRLPGTGLVHVLDYRQAFADPAGVGPRVAVIGAGGIAVDLAHLLAADAPRQITIMRRGGRVGEGIGPTTRWAVLQQLRAAGVRMLTGVSYRRITPEGVEITRTDGEAGLVAADTVILAAGQEPATGLAAGLAAAGTAHTVVGGALDTEGLNAVRAFDQGLRAGTAIARDLLGGAALPD
ncbi:FAD-dependent oxidoreductase [Arthrobacter sp. I2-34]|uniref:FAD-dependent oxidoreductase n=1 Tax=Arthrobacter hankyongi TaxID=2904801 RepID=A0ABS9L4N1_9MICC|nr:FAD-dependent oxidoreductase [Arthrobacter hankyongi]MCG2621576.1 FAD-dependent oxidoreductase [Arthrobacter hankyongi]